MSATTARKPLVLVPQHFGSLVFDRRCSRYFPFDQETTALLLRARHAPAGAILDEVSGPRREVLERFFEHFERLGFFTLDRRFAADALDLVPPGDHLAGPLAVHLEVSAACNLTCAHCFAGELPRREPALSLAELEVLFGELASLGSFRLGLTGGEPLLRKDLCDILDAALAHGLHPCLTTNGLLLTEEIARALGQRDLVWINVSLDGATARTNDPVRGEGTFERVTEKVRLLAKHARFTMAFTVTSLNAGEAREAAALAAELGASTAVFRPLYPVGVAERNLDLMPTFDEYGGALDALDTLAGLDVRVLDPFGPRLREPSRAVIQEGDACGAGSHVCSISLGGDVNPCSFLGDGFVGGNLRRRRFAEIWHDSQVFQGIRGAPGGGCRARSLVLAGDATAPDPWLVQHDRRPGAPAGRARHPLSILETSGRLKP